MSDLSYLLNDVRQSVAEKRRSLKGIEELLRLGKSHVRAALPQVSPAVDTPHSLLIL